MLKVMVADDEAVVRRGLRNTIAWAAHGFELVGEADDGVTALELSEKLKPDIIITDICMPIMDGIEYIKKLREKEGTARVIVLSGHDRFDYARDAIQYGIHSYILKPIDNNELLRQLLNLKEEIQREKKAHLEFDRLRVLVQENRLTLREKLLYDLVKGNAEPEGDIRQKLEFFGLQSLDGCLVVLVADIDNYPVPFEGLNEEEMQIRKFALVRLAEGKLAAYGGGCAFNGADRQIVAVLALGRRKSEASRYKTIFSFCEELKNHIKEQFGFTVTIGVSRNANGIADLKRGFDEAVEAVSQKFWIGKSSVIYAQDFRYGEIKDCAYPVEAEAKVLSGIVSTNGDLAREGLEDFFAKLLETMCPGPYLQHVHKMALRLIGRIDRMLMDRGTDMYDILDNGVLSLKAVFHFQTVDDVKIYTEGIVDKIVAHFRDENNLKYRQEITKAIRYINEHFNEAIDLNIVAEYIHISQYYLSRLFKKETGRNFVDYLNSVRIERAKALMRDGTLKLYEIAERVGYNDNAYFGQMFKKFEGISPGDYRRKE